MVEKLLLYRRIFIVKKSVRQSNIHALRVLSRIDQGTVQNGQSVPDG